MNYKEAMEHCIFRFVSGSQAYGTNRPDSDEDIRGVFIAPLHCAFDLFQTSFMGSTSVDGQLKGTVRDIQEANYAGALERIRKLREPDQFDLHFSVGTVKKLGEDEEIQELRKFLKLASECNPNIIEFLYVDRLIMHETDVWRKIKANRGMFLSKKVRYTFSGYAIAQLKRIKSHRGYLMNPPKAQPSRKDFGLPGDSSIPKKYQRAIMSLKASYLAEEVRDQVVKEQEYKDAMVVWSAYKKWERERNPARKEMEAKYGYDCYLDDTEFLTPGGWKRYELIGDEEVATVEPSSGQMVFQRPEDRFSKDYDGPILFIGPQFSTCAVTSNHKLWLSRCHRSKKNNYSQLYDTTTACWGLTEASEALSGHASHFHFRLACEPRTADFPVSDSDLRVMACYVSDGYVVKRSKDGLPTTLRFSHAKGGRLLPVLDQILTENKDKVRPFIYSRDESGEGSRFKRLPSWCWQLSERQVRVFLGALLLGDGTFRKFSDVYYTSSFESAGAVQAMCIQAGIVSSVWGPYFSKASYGGCWMYQVYIGREDRVKTMKLSKFKSSHVKIRKVQNRKVVCFTVPNGILVTRRNGKVALHGNSKHAAHLVRLVRMAKEILAEGVVHVYRPDREELREILTGQWPYERLLEETANLDQELDELYAKSDLRKKPDHEGIAELYREICEESYGITLH